MQIWKSGTLEVVWHRVCSAGCGSVPRPCFSPDGRYAQFHDGESVFILEVGETKVQLLETIRLPSSKNEFGYKAIAVAPNAHSLAVLDSHVSDKSILTMADLPEFEDQKQTQTDGQFMC